MNINQRKNITQWNTVFLFKYLNSVKHRASSVKLCVTKKIKHRATKINITPCHTVESQPVPVYRESYTV